MQLQAGALFTHTAAGRIRHVAEPGYPASELLPAPRFFLGRTPAGNIWRLRDDIPDDLAAKLEHLCRTEPPLMPGQTEATIAPQVRCLLLPVSEHRGPTYLLPAQPENPASTAILLTAENKHLLEAHFPTMLERPWQGRAGPVAASLEGGQVVAVCTCSRYTAHAAEAGLETAEAFRGRGHAVAAASLWARAVQASGRLALYSTSWDNLASQRVAARLRATQYGEDWSVE